MTSLGLMSFSTEHVTDRYPEGPNTDTRQPLKSKNNLFIGCTRGETENIPVQEKQ